MPNSGPGVFPLFFFPKNRVPPLSCAEIAKDSFLCQGHVSYTRRGRTLFSPAFNSAESEAGQQIVKRLVDSPPPPPFSFGTPLPTPPNSKVTPNQLRGKPPRCGEKRLYLRKGLFLYLIYFSASPTPGTVFRSVKTLLNSPSPKSGPAVSQPPPLLELQAARADTGLFARDVLRQRRPRSLFPPSRPSLGPLLAAVFAREVFLLFFGNPLPRRSDTRLGSETFFLFPKLFFHSS